MLSSNLQGKYRMNINQFSITPLISSQLLELNDNNLSVIESDFFQQLLQFNDNEKPQLDKHDNEDVADLLPTFKEEKSNKEDKNDSDALITLFVPPLLNSQLEQPSTLLIAKEQLTEQTEQIDNNKPLLETNLKKIDRLLEVNPSEVDKQLIDIDRDIALDNKASEILTSINNSEQLITKTNEHNDNNLLPTKNIQHQTTKSTNLFETVKTEQISQESHPKNIETSVVNTVLEQSITDNHSDSNITNSHQESTLLTTPKNIETSVVNTVLEQSINDNQSDSNITNSNQESTLLTTVVNSQVPSPSSPSVAVAQLNMTLPMPMDIAKWQASLNEQISLITRQGIQNAEIKLHPEELGSLHIKLAMIDEKMDLHMTVAHNVVKSVLELALPQLRTSLEEQGITLQQTNISDSSMMDDSKQSTSYRQKQQFEPELFLDDEKQAKQESSHNTDVIQSGLSIFA